MDGGNRTTVVGSIDDTNDSERKSMTRCFSSLSSQLC